MPSIMGARVGMGGRGEEEVAKDCMDAFYHAGVMRIAIGGGVGGVVCRDALGGVGCAKTAGGHVGVVTY